MEEFWSGSCQCFEAILLIDLPGVLLRIIKLFIRLNKNRKRKTRKEIEEKSGDIEFKH